MDSLIKNIRCNIEITKIKAEVVKLRDNNKENKQLIQDILLKKVVDISSFFTYKSSIVN